MSTSTSLELEDPAPRLPTKVFEGHTSVVELVAYFRDGKRITFSGSKDNTVRIWNVESQKQNGESLVHDFPVHSMALSPDERRLVSGGRGVVLWDLEGRTVVWKKEVDETDGQHVAYSPDGRLIAASHNEEIVLLDAETGEQIRQPLQLGGFVRCLTFSPDWTQIAAGSYNGNVQVFEVATGETVVGTFTAHTAGVMSLVYTPDGQQFVTASMDHSIRVWDAATGQEIGDSMLGHRGWVRQISCSRDGQRLASASTDSTVRVWDLKTRRQIGVPLRIQGNYDFYSVSWSPDGRSIIAGLLSGRICLWDVPPHDDHPVIPQAPAPTTSSPPVLNTSRPRLNSISSSILNLPAGSSPTPSQSPEANTGPGEDDDQREYPTNESFDSVLDLPADGTQPAQKRKRRRRRRTLNSSLPIPAVPNTLAITAPESHAPQSQTTPPSKAIAADAPVDAQTSGSRFGQLTRSWIRRLTKSTLRRTRKPSFANVDDPLQARDKSKTTHAAQKSQGNAAEENTSEPRQVNNSRPRQRRQRHTRRNEETGMIAPAPMYDRYQVATEEYWYDPNNPPLIDRIFFCMICCGVPKDDASFITNADPTPVPNPPTPHAHAGPSHSQDQPDPSIANTATPANTNTSTPTSHLRGFGHLWQCISNVARRLSHRKQPESHQLQNINHAPPQPLCHTTVPRSSGCTTPASSHYATPTSSGYATPTSPGSVVEQHNQV